VFGAGATLVPFIVMRNLLSCWDLPNTTIPWLYEDEDNIDLKDHT
jgi:hypothetical protein